MRRSQDRGEAVDDRGLLSIFLDLLFLLDVPACTVLSRTLRSLLPGIESGSACVQKMMYAYESVNSNEKQKLLFVTGVIYVNSSYPHIPKL